MNVQYRVVFGKKDESVSGPDDAEVVMSIAAADAGLDPAVAFMQGRLKATGPSSVIFGAFRSGAAAAEIARLAVR